jgi:hypothetical protein
VAGSNELLTPDRLDTSAALLGGGRPSIETAPRGAASRWRRVACASCSRVALPMEASSRTSARRFGRVDLALLPIGAYEPRWFMQSVHMNPFDAVQAHIDLGASESIGIHFGTFPMTTEGIDEPVRALAEACRARNVPLSRFRTLGFGESVRFQ